MSLGLWDKVCHTLLEVHVGIIIIHRTLHCTLFCIIYLAMDVGRALLKFAVGYPLGEKGLDWLKIHLVNLHGEKKK